MDTPFWKRLNYITWFNEAGSSSKRKKKRPIDLLQPSVIKTRIPVSVFQYFSDLVGKPSMDSVIRYAPLFRAYLNAVEQINISL